jgi:thiol-disulfide isomerase/thioredoxin
MTMRKLLALAALAGFVTPTAAEDAKLKVGDKAPALRATKWLQGAEVKEFAEGKAYVVEFWATWCGPCIVMMPHMGELQAEYKAKGVTFVGFTAKDPNNSLEKVQALVEKRGPKLGYTFAYADNSETHDAWMTAAGRSGIPCCFVIDKAGKIAYIGHPMFLDVVLPKVVEGQWTADDTEGLKKIETETRNALNAAFGTDAEAGLKALADFEKKYPKLASVPYFNAPRITLLLKAKRVDEAKKTVAAVMAKAFKQDDPTALTAVSSVLRGPDANGEKELLALSLRAAESALKLAGDKDIFVLLTVAEAHFANGDRARAKEFGAKAVAASEKEPDFIKKVVAREVGKFDDEKKDK